MRLMESQNTRDEIDFSGNQSTEKSFRQLWTLTGYTDELIDHVCDMFLAKPLREVWVLDAGCGHGMWSKCLSNKGYSVVGTDVSNVRLKSAMKWNSNEHTSFVVCDVMKAPILKEVFHGCLSSLFLHHFRNLELIISEFFRVTKNNGELIIYEPNGLNPIYRITESVKKFVPRTWMLSKHIDSTNETIHSVKSYVNVLRNQGFLPIKIVYLSSNEQNSSFNREVIVAYLNAYGTSLGLLMLGRLSLLKLVSKIPIKSLSCDHLIIHAQKVT